MNQAVQRVVWALALTAGAAYGADTLPFVSPIFGDGMVLQRGKPNTIWGWSQAGDSVKVEIGTSSAAGTAGADGKWQVKILPPALAGPYTVKISGKQAVELKDVLVGDVWICAGQSNMQFELRQARGGADEIKNANYPQMRYFLMGEKAAYNKQDVPRGGSWKSVTPEGMAGRGGISAVAYFFGKKIHLDAKVPVGLIQEAVGGVPADTFMSPDALRPLKDYDAGLAMLEQQRQKGGKEYGNYIMHWYDEYDTGSKNGSWADPALEESSWKPVQVPGTFKELGVDTVASLIWLRKEIMLPDPLPAGGGRVLLGSVDKMDTVYINGQQIGSSSWVENPRAYGARGLKPGKNVIAIRLLNTKPGTGGFISGADSLKLVLGETTFPLAGEWKGKVAVDTRDGTPLPPGYESVTSMVSVLYNGMLAPIAPLAITGAIWYQGESNTTRAWQYRKVMPALIADWRKLFGQGDFPFYLVGLPAYQKRKDVPGTDDWAEMRESQALTAKTVPNTCLATTVDTGDPDNIHPIDKKEVGDRLAACALAGHYKQKVVWSGPTFAKMEKLNGGAVKIHFDHTDGGLVVKGENMHYNPTPGGLVEKGAKTGEFQIAGEDQKWYWADARVEGLTVIVSSPSVANPVAVRYAWQANPLASLYNGAGFPAVPFRTDDWPGVTVGNVIY